MAQAAPPVWLMRLLRWGVGLFAPILPARWVQALEHAALFIFMGVVNNVLAYILYVILLNVFDCGRTGALFGAYALGMLIAYYNFSRFVFSSDVKQPLARFVAAYIALYLINRLLLEGVVVYGGLGSELAQLLLLVPVAALSYVINRFVVFR